MSHIGKKLPANASPESMPRAIANKPPLMSSIAESTFAKAAYGIGAVATAVAFTVLTHKKAWGDEVPKPPPPASQPAPKNPPPVVGQYYPAPAGQHQYIPMQQAPQQVPQQQVPQQVVPQQPAPDETRLDPELAKLQRFSAAKLKRLEAETCQKHTCEYDKELQSVKWNGRLDIQTKKGKLTAMIEIDETDDSRPRGGRELHELSADEVLKGWVMTFFLDAKPIGTADLDYLRVLHRMATGAEFNYLRFAVEEQTDEYTKEVYPRIYLRPVRSLNEEVMFGMPAMYVDVHINSGKIGAGWEFLLWNLPDQK